MDKEQKLGTIKNSGFVAPVFLGANEHVLGVNSDIPDEVVVADGQWLKYFTSDEVQEKNGVETYGCTCFGSIRLITTYLKAKYGIDENYSERALYILAKVSPPGANPHDVLEIVRNMGLAHDVLLAFDDTITSLDKYRSPNPLPPFVLEDCVKFLQKLSFKHAWLFYPTATVEYKQKMLMETLDSCPVGVSVDAWRMKDGLYYKQVGAPDNHWTTVVGYEKDKYWIVKDSYPPFDKHLEWGYDFGVAKRIHISVKEVVPEIKKKDSWLTVLLNFIISLFRKG